MIKKGFSTSKEPTVKESFIIVTLGWITAAAVGALPFLLSGTCPTYTDAFLRLCPVSPLPELQSWETLKPCPRASVLEESPTLAGWNGYHSSLYCGLPGVGVGGGRLFRAEVPGPVPEKIIPRIKETAKTLWLIYVGFTAMEIILLCLAGMSLFDSVNHAFATMATGGISTKAASVGAWRSPGIHWIITLFMFLAGVNFTLYYRAFTGRSLRGFFRDDEFKFYVFLIVAATLLLLANSLLASGSFQSLREAFRHCVFQVVSIITTTGFATVDFHAWPAFSKAILMTLVFVGGCAGSTACAIKVGRVLILIKHVYNEVFRFIYPRAVTFPKINGLAISRNVVDTVTAFFFLYMAIYVSGSLIMSGFGLDFVSSASAVAATLGNAGPALMVVGPPVAYQSIPALGKWVLSACMLLGRLELFTVLVLFIPDFWRKR